MHIAVERLRGAVLLLLVFHSPERVVPALRQGGGNLDARQVRELGVEAKHVSLDLTVGPVVHG
ncbi:hypothetical protein ALP96_200113 [Pseudomonas savastanoi pv. glycinea]|nr:hypothetical protein ALP96_200113 [Pseudomonas savastanoi pv. glycinea]RMR00719.1 hypothetical protein ALP95_200016 [Pseudomonas savastanoi pv. glycinea]